LADWSESRGLRFSSTKSSVVNFTRKRCSPSINLSLYGHRLPVVTSVKFLGIILDSKLNWCHHITELKKKCLGRLNLLKMLNGSSWGADRKCLLRLYKTHLRSILDYSSIIYGSASSGILQKLDVIQNQALRICTGALRSSPISSLHVETNIVPLTHHRSGQILRYYFKVLKNPTHINAYRLNCPTQSSCSTTLQEICRSLLHFYDISPSNLEDLPMKAIHQQLDHSINIVLQCQWTNGPSNKLRLLKPTLEEWSTSYQENRKLEKVLARLRIGHTIATHQYLFTRSPPPICARCEILIDVPHLLNDCQNFSISRELLFGFSPFPVYNNLTNTSPKFNTVVQFLFREKSALYNSI